MRWWGLCWCLLWVACQGVKPAEMDGVWANSEMQWIFETEQQRFRLAWEDRAVHGRYRKIWNSLELIGADNRVLFNANIKSIQGDTMILDLPSLGSSREIRLLRVHEGPPPSPL